MPAAKGSDAQWLSAPADAVDRAATVHRCSRPHSNTRGTDARGHHGSRDRPRSQYDAGPYDAPGRIRNVLAVHYGTGLFTARNHETGYQQRRMTQSELHFCLLHMGECLLLWRAAAFVAPSQRGECLPDSVNLAMQNPTPSPIGRKLGIGTSVVQRVFKQEPRPS
jgi:hypothetical protein